MHLYEHPINVANFTIERKYQDEDVVFFVQIRRPEARSLRDLDEIIRTCQYEPVESVKFFKRAIRMSKVPWLFRKLTWWVCLKLFGKLRCHNFGTFSLTSVAAEGGGVLHMTPLLTSTLHYGLFDDRGVLFGAGYLLRHLHMRRQMLELESSLDVTTAPQMPVRGHQLGYRPKTNAYDAWSVPMWDQYIRELAIFGTNTAELIPPRSDDADDCCLVDCHLAPQHSDNG